MPSAQVSSYTAHVGRLGALGPDRLLVLSHVLIRENTAVEGASEIYFADRFGESENGYSTIGEPERVQAHLPAADYDAWLDLLRHEAPVYLHWTVGADATADGGGIIHLATGPEPPGEGPTDYSR